MTKSKPKLKVKSKSTPKSKPPKTKSKSKSKSTPKSKPPKTKSKTTKPSKPTKIPTKASHDPNSALEAAVERNELRGVTRAFAAGADPNFRGAHRTVAATALEKKNPAIAEAFIAVGLDANLDLTGTVDDGWSLLMLASNAPTARALIAAGADVHFQSPVEQGDTVLTMAAKLWPAEVLAVLIEHGADPNRPRGDGCTPLIEAGPRVDSVKVLLEAGAIDVPAYQGQSALDIAIDCQSDKLVALLKRALVPLPARAPQAKHR